MIWLGSRLRSKVYLYEVRYENGKHVWKYLGKVTNELPTTSEKGKISEKIAGSAGFEPAICSLGGFLHRDRVINEFIHKYRSDF